MTSDFLELFDMEVQNRAFALRICEGMVKRVSDPDDVNWYTAWLGFEQFNQEQYAPFAEKYGLSQEPRVEAKIQAGFGSLGATVLPDNVMLKYMLRETITYLEKLKELARVAPEEDQAFFNYVVEQEELQVDALQLRVDGKSRESAELIRQFVAAHSN